MINGIHNAKISKTLLGFEDHGIFTFYLMMDTGHAIQAFGGWDLRKQTDTPDYTTTLIQKILKVVGVGRWEQLSGESCRIDIQNGTIEGLGHYLKTEWVYPRKMFDELKIEVPAG